MTNPSVKYIPVSVEYGEVVLRLTPQQALQIAQACRFAFGESCTDDRQVWLTWFQLFALAAVASGAENCLGNDAKALLREDMAPIEGLVP
jgi:hypothetical protein